VLIEKPMMKNLLFSFLCLILSISSFSQAGYQIRVNLKPYKGSKIWLGYYYGKLKAVADSTLLDAAGNGQFKGKDKLMGGVYFVVSPNKEILFELLIDSHQNFSVVADTGSFPSQVKFTGSPDNTMFQSYTQFMATQGTAISKEQAELAKATRKEDSTQIISRIRALNMEVQHYREDIEKKSPRSLLAMLLRALREPTIPDQEKNAAKKTDSLFAYHYYKAHYWDGVSFTDDRLIRTPIFEPKLDKYYKDLVPPEPDSINREVDKMLLESRTNKEMFKYLLVHFVQKYVNPEYMGQDAVFVHLFEKYINTGQADFFTDKYRKYVNDRAYSLMANLIGQPAANLEMTDSLDKPLTLYSVDAPFIVICFWDPTCGHCQETVPKVDSIYQAKWKAEGIKIYGVMVDGGKDNWVKFIKDHNLKDWINVYQTQAAKDAESASNKPGFRQLYDVYQTPILYLLDRDKRIIAKKLTYQQFDEVIDLKLKNTKSK
jgi:thiol-disulfide isomerase/thioredoxin